MERSEIRERHRRGTAPRITLRSIRLQKFLEFIE
jgi:hypothetical protein